MKIQIQEIRSGKIKIVDKRFADILVKLKQVVYYESPENKATYQTKVMTAAGGISTSQKIPAPEAQDTDNQSDPDQEQTEGSSEPPSTEAEKNPLDLSVENTDNGQPKRRGRPPKNTYDTKVMTAEE